MDDLDRKGMGHEEKLRQGIQFMAADIAISTPNSAVTGYLVTNS